jgi:gamma-glutamyltranspeptidase/glutathione hydrolase
VAKSAAAASDAHAADAARDALAGGNAVDAVVAGVLAAAAEVPSVLLGPAQLIVGGAGSGLLAFDGRLRQPGRGAPRPRGFLAEEAVPDAARIAVPTLPATLAAVIATAGTWSLLRACGDAVARAKGRSGERASTLEAFARRGAPALSSGYIATELLAAAGRASRGLLTAHDLASIRPELVRCDEPGPDSNGILMVPWLDEHLDASATQVVAAADARGLVAVACYEAPHDGLAIPALGVVAPKAAQPVMRGQARVAPGVPLVASAPMALRARGGSVDLAIGLAELPEAQRLLGIVVAQLARTATITEAWATVTGGRPVALSRATGHVHVVASA